MVDPAVLPGFLLIALAICVAPGPDMAFVAAMSISGGSLSGVRAAAGMAAGMAVWTLATALGLAALLHAVPAAMEAIRIAGAAYLLVLGITTLRSARKAATEPVPAPPGGRIVLRGLLTNLGNPKIVVFFAAFLPQFVRASAGPAWSQLLILGLLFLVMGLAVDSAVATAAGALALVPGGRVQVVLGVTAGLVLCGLAVGLALEAIWH
jgi:threonine/homoserine/homoserine lactone efflux protein